MIDVLVLLFFLVLGATVYACALLILLELLTAFMNWWDETR